MVSRTTGIHRSSESPQTVVVSRETRSVVHLLQEHLPFMLTVNINSWASAFHSDTPDSEVFAPLIHPPVQK